MRRAAPWLLVAILAGFVLGLLHLHNLRFEAGDSYPPYSTFRADPLGAKALLESVDHLIPARRNLLPIEKLEDNRDTTILWLGASSSELRFTEQDYKHLEAFILNGGRILFALEPSVDRPRVNSFQTRGNTGRRGTPARQTTNSPAVQPGDEWADPRLVSIREKWAISFDYTPLTRVDGKIVPSPAFKVDSVDDSALPRRISVHSGLHFGKPASPWRTIYTRTEGTNQYAVVMERALGRGSVVLCADSYYFSNEALREDRQSELLAWFVGPAREVLFDETHLGVQDNPGVATLARKYRLEALFLSLLVLAGLFIWKNSVPFMPPYEEQLAREHGNEVVGKDTVAGFTNLLRRHVPPSDLLKVCLEQWNAHFSHTRKPSAAKLEAMQTIINAQNALPPNERKPVETYRDLADVLAKGVIKRKA